MSKKTYQIPVVAEAITRIEVEADSLEDAIKLALESPSVNAYNYDVIDDTHKVDYEGLTDYDEYQEILEPFTVVATYHDNGQSWVGHVWATQSEDAEMVANLQVHNEMRQANLDTPTVDQDYPEIDDPYKCPNHLSVVAVFKEHLFMMPISG